MSDNQGLDRESNVQSAEPTESTRSIVPLNLQKLSKNDPSDKSKIKPDIKLKESFPNASRSEHDDEYPRIPKYDDVNGGNATRSKEGDQSDYFDRSTFRNSETDHSPGISFEFKDFSSENKGFRWPDLHTPDILNEKLRGIELSSEIVADSSKHKFDDSSPLINGTFKQLYDFHVQAISPSDISINSSEEELANSRDPKLIHVKNTTHADSQLSEKQKEERIEWQKLLESYLTGEELEDEKRLRMSLQHETYEELEDISDSEDSEVFYDIDENLDFHTISSAGDGSIASEYAPNSPKSRQTNLLSHYEDNLARFSEDSRLGEPLIPNRLLGKNENVSRIYAHVKDQRKHLPKLLWAGLKYSSSLPTLKNAFESDDRDSEALKLYESQRMEIDSFLKLEILGFKIDRGNTQSIDEHESSAYKKVSAVLSKLDNYQMLYQSQKSFVKHHPQIKRNKEMRYRINALQAWFKAVNLISDLEVQFKKKLGYSDIYQNDPPEPIVMEAISEIGRFFSPQLSGAVNKFADEVNYRTAPLSVQFDKSKESRNSNYNSSVLEICKILLRQNERYFHYLGLPSFSKKMINLCKIPMYFMEKAMKIKLSADLKVTDCSKNNRAVLVQLSEDYKKYLSDAVEAKMRFIELRSLLGGNARHIDSSEDFGLEYDDYLLKCLKVYLKLLQAQYRTARISSWFKHIEYLEKEWTYLRKISQYIREADSFVATELCALIERLWYSISIYFESAMKIPSGLSQKDIIKWFGRALDTIRLRGRRLLQVSKAIAGDVENSVLMTIESVDGQGGINPLKNFIANLDASNSYRLLKNTNNCTVLIHENLLENVKIVDNILRPRYWSEKYSDRVPEHVLVFPGSPENYNWSGKTLAVPCADFSGDFKPLGHDLCLRFCEKNVESIQSMKSFLLLTANSWKISHERDAAIQFFKSTNPAVQINSGEVRCPFFLLRKSLKKIRKTIFQLNHSLLTSLCNIRELTGSANCVELIENWFTFLSDFAFRSYQFIDGDAMKISLKQDMINFAIDWVSFTCSDCSPLDRRTFRWALMALEFVMLITRGNNILELEESSFRLIRSKVACCMTLLVSNFDVEALEIGGKMDPELDQVAGIEVANATFSNYNEADEYLARSNNDLTRNDRLEAINALEDKLAKNLQSKKLAGKILDTSTETDQEIIDLLKYSSSTITLKWQMGDFIGGGAFGSVYKAINLEAGDLMAVKEIKFQDHKVGSNFLKPIREEMAVLEILDHPNLINYYGIQVHRNKVFIFMEYCSGGSLKQVLENGPLESELIVQLYAYEILKGLQYLHANSVVHRDVKPENILLDYNGDLKLADFGAARKIETSITNKPSLRGTPSYMAPEVINGKIKGANLGCQDIWSAGCVILECITGKRPWSNLDNEWAIMYHIGASKRPNLPPLKQETANKQADSFKEEQSEQVGSMSKSGIEFLEECFKPADVRPTVTELLETVDYLVDIQQRLTEFNRSNSGLESRKYSHIQHFLLSTSPGVSPSLNQELKSESSSYFPPRP